jgi:hypothetical protein
MAGGYDLRQYLAEAGGRPSPELRRYLGELQANVDVASRVSSELNEGLLLPSERTVVGFAPVSPTRGTVPADYWFVLVALDEYVPLGDMPDGTPDSAIQEILQSYDHLGLLLLLAQLNRQCDRQEDLDRLTDYYRSVLNEPTRERLDAAISRRESPRDRSPRIVARQCILAAMKELLRQPLDDGVSREAPQLFDAIMLTHAFGSVLGLEREENREELGGVPANMMLYLVRNQALYQEDNAYASIDRTLRLWQDFAPHARKENLRAEPAELLREATGLELEDLLAMGLAAWGHANAWSPEQPLLMTAKYGAMPEDRVKLFHSVVAAGLDEFQIRLRDPTSQFDFLSFEQKPVLELDNGFLVLDQRYLLARVTSGLFWLVNDHERITRGREDDSARWRRAYGAMVEAIVEDQLRSMAPTLLEGDRTKAFYTEEDFERAYGAGISRPDATIDFGHRMLVFEVQSGQLSKGTRADGDVEWFKRDTDRLILSKYRQLNSGGRALLNDPRALTGDPLYPDMKVLPFVVVGGGYPGEAVSGGYVEDLATQRGLFADEGFGKPGIVSPAELEILEGLFEGGEDIAALLEQWKMSGLRNVSLWNFLAEKFPDQSRFRPTRMRPRVEATFEDLEARLRLRE